MSHANMIQKYVDDYDCLVEGIEHLLQIEQQVHTLGSMEPLRRHYEQHPEDRLCHVYRPGDRAIVLCRRSGLDAIHRMARRLVDEAPNASDLSAPRIAEIIREHILQVAIDRVTDDEELVRRLRRYVADSEREHRVSTYHFPCVLLHRSNQSDGNPSAPDHFTFGPVMFQQFDRFVEQLHRAAVDGEREAEDAIRRFSKHAKQHGWVATVRIPRCAPDVSRRRAEEVIETAINLLKVCVGLQYARSMRLPHIAPSRNRETCVLTDTDGQVSWSWQGRSLEGALIAFDPTAAIPQSTKAFASDLLSYALSGTRDAATNRLIDALRWFGDASFETAGGVQIVKWIAALERLTATERRYRDLTHRFCSRVSILASGLGAGDIEKAYLDANRAYDLRSAVMHGASSQSDEHLSSNVGLVHDLAREALLGALKLHHLVTCKAGDGRVENLESIYEHYVNQFNSSFTRLRSVVKNGPVRSLS